MGIDAAAAPATIPYQVPEVVPVCASKVTGVDQLPPCSDTQRRPKGLRTAIDDPQRA